jgi:hypothetical protein
MNAFGIVLLRNLVLVMDLQMASKITTGILSSTARLIVERAN